MIEFCEIISDIKFPQYDNSSRDQILFVQSSGIRMVSEFSKFDFVCNTKLLLLTTTVTNFINLNDGTISHESF